MPFPKVLHHSSLVIISLIMVPYGDGQHGEIDGNISTPELVHPQGSGLWRYALSIFEKEECPELRLAQFERIVNGLDAWDYQWFYTRAVNSGLSIVPSVNLVENIGFGEDATHTFSSGPQSYLQSHEIEFPLISPPCVVRDKARDIEYVKRFVRPPLKQRIKMQLYSFLKQLKLKSGKG